MGANCCGGNGRRKRGSRMVSSATTEPLLRESEREAVSTLLRYLEQDQSNSQLSLSDERLLSLCTLAYSDNVDLQRSAALCFSEISERLTDPITESILEPLIHLLLSSDVDVQKSSSLAVSNIALHGPAENKRTIVQAGALRPLIVLLSSESPEVQCNACGCITTLATSEVNKAEMVHQGAVGPLLNLTRAADGRVQRNAAGALLNLTHIDSNRQTLVEAGAVPVFVHLLESRDEDIRFYSAAALSNIAVNASHRKAIMSAKNGRVVNSLITLMESESEKVRCQACLAIRNLASEDENQKLIVDYGGLTALVPLLRSPDAETVTAAVAAIRNLSIHRDNAEAIVGSGVLDELQRLVSQQDFPEVQCHTAGTLRNLAAEDQTQAIIAAGCLLALAEQLKDSRNVPELVLSEVSAAMAVLAADATARKQIMELYGGNFYKVLLKLTESPYSEVQYNCAGVIGHLAINESVSCDINRLTGLDTEARRRSSALLILKLKEYRRVSQVAVDNVVENSIAQYDQTALMIVAGIRAQMAEKGLDPNDFDFDATVRDGLETKYKQDKYFKEKLDLIEPEEIRIGNPEHVRQFTGEKSRFVPRYDTYHYVPLLLTLEKLLQDPTILEQIDNSPSRVRTDGILEDFCDAGLFKHHPLFSTDAYALQIIGYFDELEICNPLGTHIKKHKVGIVFFTLGNIHPKFRSTFRAMNLVIVATKPVIEKHGLDAILEPFFRDLNILATKGFNVCIDGSERLFKGALLTFLADNLASNELGGFKLSFSFSFRFCRTCLIKHDEIAEKYTCDSLVKRSQSNHEQQCKQLVGPTKSHYSKTYGINRRSALLDVVHFCMFDGGLPHDMMHDILEGVASREVKLLLKHCISRKYLTLEEYNRRLINFNFGYTESDKPVPILSSHFQTDKPIRSSASQMRLLLQILPFLIGDKIPESEDCWKCFLLLRKIVDIVLCPLASENTSSSLGFLIKEHQIAFMALYPAHFIPKMHFLLHYPAQILQLGPLVRTWTIRYEAKLNFFKQASTTSGYKNITLSLANHHQRWMCYEMSTSKLIHSPSECGPSKTPTLLKDERAEFQANVLKEMPNIRMDTVLHRPNWVHREGVTYKSNNAFVIVGSDGLDPLFACIDELIVIGGDMLIFCVRLCDVLYFDSHYHAYVINVTSQQSVISKLLDRMCITDTNY